MCKYWKYSVVCCKNIFLLRTVYFRSVISEVDNGTSTNKTKPIKNKKIVFDIEEEIDEEPASKKRKLDHDIEDRAKHKKSKKKKEKQKEDDKEIFEEPHINDLKHSKDHETEAEGSIERKKHKKKKKKE